jgi:hypothetical protein
MIASFTRGASNNVMLSFHSVEAALYYSTAATGYYQGVVLLYYNVCMWHLLCTIYRIQRKRIRGE